MQHPWLYSSLPLPWLPRRGSSMFKPQWLLVVLSIGLALVAGPIPTAVAGEQAQPDHSFILTDLGGLPNSSGTGAFAINNRGEVVGTSVIGFPPDPAADHAFLWTDGVMRDLGVLPGQLFSDASGINNAGQVVRGSNHAFSWKKGAMTDIGTLPGDRYSVARGINDQGQIVGDSGLRPQQTHATRAGL